MTLRAAPGSGSFLYRWENCPDFDLDATCTLALTQPETNIDAVFLPNATLQVGVTGNDGLVSLSSGAECEASQNGGGACNFQVAPGSSVTLTPNVAPGSTFVGWSVPECPGTGACTIVMDSRLRSVMATFNPTDLSVITSNEGIVRSAESPAKIDCGSDVDDCSADYQVLTEVTLTASPAGDFLGWNGVCRPAGTAPACTFRLSGDDVVGAWFRGDDGPPEIIPPRIDFSLEVRKTGAGEGTVTSTRSRFSDAIRCGATAGCDAVFEQGETATLVASPSPGSVFTGWKSPGDLCSADRTCRFEVLRASRLEAAFSRVARACAARRLGGRRADRLDGGAGGDLIYGRAGNDRIRGLGGNDCLFGERGNDVLLGGPGDDSLAGGVGADELHGGTGGDTLQGGRGRDRIFAMDGARDVISCGPGRDTVRADRIDRTAGCERRVGR